MFWWFYIINAKELAEKFSASGTREKDIKELSSIIKKENPFVLEIGCVNGRNAKEILKYTNRYLGLDVAEKLIEIARSQVSQADFVSRIQRAINCR